MSVALVVDIIGDASQLAKSLDQAEGKAGGFAGAIGGSALKVAAIAGVAGVAAGAIAEMTNAAAADEAAQAKLQAALEAAGVATGDYMTQVDAAIAQGQEKAFSDDQTREALQSLVTATGDLTTSTGLLTSAQDIARFANVDLATAADAVAKAQAGQDGPLRKLIPGLEKGASATDTLAAATAQAAGQADAYANSTQGMQDKAGDAFGELTETIGSIFLPVLKELLPALTPILQSFGKLVSALLPLLIPLLRIVGQVLGIVARALSVVVDWLVQLVKWVVDAIGAVGRFLDSINPLKNVSLPSLPFLSATAGAPPGARSARFGAPATRAASLQPQITIYTTGDGIEAEQAVMRALRRQTRLNAGVVPALGWQVTG